MQLVDAAAAPFGSFDAIHLLGLVDGEWPRRQRRNIFYSPALLTALGWPADQPDPLAPARAAFVDLLQSATAHASVSTFTLEDDALVEPSSLLDDIGRAGLTPIALDIPDVRVFQDEALALAGSTDGETRGWPRTRRRDAAMGRAARVAPAATLPRSMAPPARSGPRAIGERARAVRAVPVQVLRPIRASAGRGARRRRRAVAPRTRPDAPRAVRGHLRRVAVARAGTITPERLEEARALALATMETHLARLSQVDAALERTRLVGSPVAAGLIDVVLRLEAERPTEVVERRLEHAIDGVYHFAGPEVRARSRCAASPIASTC